MQNAKIVRVGWADGFQVLAMAILATLLIAASTSVHAQTFSTLVNFDNTHGRYSFTPLSQGRDGNLYGTTGEGGANSFGTVFKLTPKRKLTLLYSFGGTEPQYPSGLLLGKDGNFYGTTYNGGANGVGAVFKVTPTGKLTTLHSFDTTDGSHPWGVSLVLGDDGNFYGTTPTGGANNSGTVFKITPKGVFTTLCSLPSGSYTAAGLVLGNDGNFYGMTVDGGKYGNGTAFQVTPTGSLTFVLYFLEAIATDVVEPAAVLLLGNDGNLYGTSILGGVNGLGSAFQLQYGGGEYGYLPLLYFFGGADGEYPQGAGLIQGSDGPFYGTTPNGGANGTAGGTIFQLQDTYNGFAVTTLHSFDGTDGSSSYSGLWQHTNGTFYGTTSSGGSQGYGTIFSLTDGAPAFVSFLLVPGKVGETVGLLGQGFNGTTGVAFNGIPAQFKVVSNTYLTAVVPQNATAGFVTVATPAGTLTSVRLFQVQ